MFPPSARHSSLRTRRLLSAVSGFASVFLGLCLALERSDLIRIDANHEVVDMIDRLCLSGTLIACPRLIGFAYHIHPDNRLDLFINSRPQSFETGGLMADKTPLSTN